jgi:hypothetical protein
MQARLLLRLGCPVDMAQSGLVFVKSTAERVAAIQKLQDNIVGSAGSGGGGGSRIPSHFKQARSGSTCIVACARAM